MGGLHRLLDNCHHVLTKPRHDASVFMRGEEWRIPCSGQGG